jgi:hemolysin activation/secretion protein
MKIERNVRLAMILAATAGLAMGGRNATAQDTGEPPRGESTYPQADKALDGETTYVVSKFLLEYEFNNPDHPPLQELFAISVTVGVLADGGYTYPRAGVPSTLISLGDTFDGKGQVFYPGGIRAVNEALANELVQRRNLIGVRVLAHPDDIALQTGEDTRAQGDTRLRLKIFTAQLGGTDVINQSQGIDPEDRKNPERLERLRENSPLNVGNLVRRDLLDDYVLRLNRHPGRRINVALVPASERPGEVELQYQVAEVKPWSIYAQVANIGTKTTGEWRERIGFAHTQLTDNDDILRLDYLTAEFGDTNSVFGSYERPFYDNQIVAKVFGSWSQYSADSVGIAGLEFEGDSYSLGAEVSGTILQRGASFVDLVGGLRFENVSVNNKLLAQEGEEDFLLPYVGLRYSRGTDIMSTSASGIFEFGLGSMTGVDQSELTKLGRIFPDEDWVVFKADAEHSMYLEPLFLETEFKEKDPSRLRGTTLAHEVALMFRGQAAFGKRLTPTFEGVAGGFYSVRGYPESVAAGDTTFVGTAEYRFHLPRTLLTTDKDGNLAYMDPNQTTFLGRPFRVGPAGPFDRTDWDLIFKGFVDFGRAMQSDRQVFERDHSLLSAGVGVELQVLQNLNIRLDWGFALHDVRGTEVVDSGDNKVHFSATILY